MNKRWVTDGKKYELLFRRNGDEVCVLSFVQEIVNPTYFWFTSDELCVEYDCETADSIDEAKEIFEEKYEEYLEDQIVYYENLLDAWKE